MESDGAAEKKDEETVQEISEAHQERMKPFSFSMCNIAIGEQIEFCYNGCEKSGPFAPLPMTNTLNTMAKRGH